MAEKKTRKAPANGRNGVDRWGSNGAGVTMKPQTAAQKRQVAESNAELARNKKTGK